ncbi:hypothetical protein BC941DRAFT_118213 [Chlamydoabsidia padenii]|nr:hypothetical protein BC941DRAFT_118213 [Chlamydoabsidia padenii]
MYATLTQQWKATEKTYRQRLEKKKSRVDRLLKQVQSLTLECTQLKKRNKAIQQQMDNMIKRLEMKDDAGSSTMRRDSRELVDMAQQGDLAQYQTTHGSLNDWAQKQDLSQQLLQSQLLLQSLLTQCQEPLSSNSLTLLSRLQAQASPSSKHQALSLSSKTQHVAPPSQRPVTLHSQASSKPLKIPQPRSPAQSLPLSSPHLPSQSQLPAQPRSPSPPSSPLQHQAPSSPLSPLQHQAPSSPLSPLQHQAPPQSRSPSPSPLQPLSPLQPQAPSSPLSPLQHQAPPQSRSPSPSPLQPLSPLQPQAPSSPLSPQVHSPSKTPQSTHSSHKRQSVSPKNVMTSPVLGMETITYNQHNRYTSEESNNDPVRPSSPEISSPVHDLLSSFDEKLDLRTHNANIKSTPKSTHHDASTPSRSKASENTTPILDMSPRSPTLPASHQRHTSPLPITEERRTDSDGFSLHDSVPSLPDEESLFLSPTTSKPASQSKINIDLTALEEDEPVRRKPLSKQPSSEATIQPSASTSKRGKKPLERRKLSLKWQQIEVPDQQGPVHNKQLSSSQTPVRNKFVQHKEPTSSQKSLQSKFVVKRSILSQKSVQDNELTSSQELTMTRKKRRRLINRSPIDETRMSPLLNGYSAKYFDIE